MERGKKSGTFKGNGTFKNKWKGEIKVELSKQFYREVALSREMERLKINGNQSGTFKGKLNF